MLLQNLMSFIERKEAYARRFPSFPTGQDLSEEDCEKVLGILSELLMDPECTEDVADCFPQLLPALVSTSISMDRVSFNDRDALHMLNSVVLGKLLCKDRDLFAFVARYFDVNPAPFESVETDYSPSTKRRNKRKMVSVVEVSDYDLVSACYDILCCSPTHFKYTWNWSKFYKYLSHNDESVRWIAMNCIAIVLDMSESCYSLQSSDFVRDIHRLSIEEKVVAQKSITSTVGKEIDDIFDDVASVVSVGGILLPALKRSKLRNQVNLVPVSSTRRNLRNLAFAVSANKCVCLQGAVGSGKTTLVEFLAAATGHDSKNFAKVQLGDQTDSKMLLGMYRCTDIPGEFLWQPGILTEAVLSGKWLLLEDFDCAATDVISIVGQLVETKTLSVPGYRDAIRIKSGFQLFVTRRLTSGGMQKPLEMSMPLQKHFSCVNVEALSKEELITVVQTLFPLLNTTASRIVDVFLLFSVGNHEDDIVNCVKTTRQISTRDLIKWCSRAVVDFNVSSPTSALKIFQDASDVFCCSVADSEERSNLAIAVAHKLGIVKTKAEYFSHVYKPSVNVHRECLVVGRATLRIRKADRVKMEAKNSNFSYTRPSVCLLERIASCVNQKEPVLLVGETGTGKTSCVQYLARITGQKLVVINMNQQSESTDLLGGYKPVDLKLFIQPIREEFEILFRSYFAIEPNLQFLKHIGHCFDERKWKTLTTLMIHSTRAALRRLAASPKERSEIEMLKKWEKMAGKLEKLESQVQSQYSLAFSFVEGSLVKALRDGEWVLLDEINLATAETLECLSGLLEGSCGSLSLLERGDKEPIERHKDFAIFSCMNPATDVGKKDLPVGLRNRFTEFYVDELTEKSDLQLLVNSYLKDLNLPSEKIDSIVKFYLNVKKEAESNLLDGTGHKPHYSLRTLCRALSVSAQNPCANALRSLYEAFCLSFLTQLDSKSYPLVQRMIVKCLLGDKVVNAIVGSPIPRPRTGPADSFVCFEGYWIPKGDLEPEPPENYVLTETVRANLKDLVRVVSIGKLPVLLQGDTSVGKTSLIAYLAKASGHSCVRINNHEHTDLQEYVGTYVADPSGRLVFKEGVLVNAMRKGSWIILDELNLAPSDVLEALNRVLDDNRELFIPEIQQAVKAHDNFMLFATQNPPGLYGGRKVLSRAFRNRFVELHFDEIPAKELQTILAKRCKMPETYCKQMIGVMTELQIRRKSSATFAGKKGFITLRDLFRWAERYRLAPDNRTTLYDWSQHLADEGYLVLSSKVRQPDECLEIIEVLKTHLRRDVDPNSLFSLWEGTSSVTRPILESLLSKRIPGFEHIVWTYQMRKMAVLLSKACEFKEPVLLIGETGGGKTTVCQLLSAIRQQELGVVNCHMHTEASDFLGSLRPVREHKENPKLFEWVDGPLVKAIKNGGFFLVDEISLADDSVLERLNSLLEPERKLLISENASTEEDATITAHENFIFVGTMNPGGDYGKRELSPALRNRFTEIWCEGCVSFDDLKSVMVHNIREGFKESVSSAIIEFLKWLQTSEIGKKLVVSVRDILTWVNFINRCKDLEIGDAFYHGAALSFIDGLGSGLSAVENLNILKDLKKSSLKFIERQVETTLESKLLLNCEELGVEDDQDKFGISPFYVKKGNGKMSSDTGFAFTSPTTRSNTLKVLRALQLKKPILLEGSPGVGKTSLISALAEASGHRLLRLNLSDQTDISDLFGADLPVEGGEPGEFSWTDGPFLRALKNGDWILLDELNLASQSVLEGLNACLDHRGEVYIPELGMTFVVKAGTRLFACQNPHRQGGARRGLPKSLLNRFTLVFVDTLEQKDFKFILERQFPELGQDILDKMIRFNEEVSSEAGITWAHQGSPWEMNLRDVSRWCEITVTAFKRNPKRNFDPGNGAMLIYVDRMRTNEDKNNVIEIYNRIFSETDYPLPDSHFPVHVTKERVMLGDEILDRSESTIYEDDDLLLLREQKAVLRSLAQCVNMNWMSILVGGSGTGKSSLVHLLAKLAGQKLKSVVISSAMDTTELLGGFEQTDYNRHFEELLDRTETLLIGILRKSLRKENLDRVVYYHSLLENVRRLSTGDEKRMETTMSTETKLFLRKTEELSKLVSAMKAFGTSCELEVREMEKKLTDLSIAVEKDKCLNAGGKFEWVNSVLVKCLQNGTWLLLDHVNLCSPAILDRLNGLLEPNGALTIGEKGVDENGQVFTVKAHTNFRLFLIMDPRYGEISRAMRNRGVEIAIPTPQRVLPCDPLDLASLLNNRGIKNLNHQKLMVKIHESLYEKQYKLNEIMQVASFTSQQVAKGFPFEDSLRNSYRDVCATFDWRSRKEAFGKMDEIFSENCTKQVASYDLDGLTLRIGHLQRNAGLAIIRQHGFLLRSAIEQCRNNSNNIDFQYPFDQPPITDTAAFLTNLLLDFYERTSFDDLPIRRIWSRNILSDNHSLFDRFERLNERLCKEIESFGFVFKNNTTSDVPLNLAEPPILVNNLAIVLYFQSIVFDYQEDGDFQRNERVIYLKEYSSAVRSGRLSSNLKNEPLILNFTELVEQSAKIIDMVLRIDNLSINDQEYVELREHLNWYERFYRLGRMELVDKTKGIFFDLREISSSLKVHYKWLTKLCKKLFRLLPVNLSNPNVEKELTKFSDKFLNVTLDVDKFRKIRKKVKKLLPIPSPHFSQDSMIYHEKLRSILKKLEINEQDLIDASKTRIKILSIGLDTNLTARETLIDVCIRYFKHNRANKIGEDDLIEIDRLDAQITQLKQLDDVSVPTNNFTDIEIWPVYEFFFVLFAYRFQRKLCQHFHRRVEEEDLGADSIESHSNRVGRIYEENVFKKFEQVATIPIHLIALTKALNSDDVPSERRIFFFPRLFSSVEEFAERSFAVKNSDVLLYWHDREQTDREDNSDTVPTNFMDKSTLCSLIFQLFLRRNTENRKEMINFGNYQRQKKLLKVIQTLLWRHSLILNTDEFGISANDSILLEFYVDYYTAAIDKVTDVLALMLNEEEQNDLKKRLFEPMKLLLEIKEHLGNTENNVLERGKGWLILGHLQIFLFHDLGSIDPVEKVALKSRYVKENISHLERLMCVERLQCNVLGIHLPKERKQSRIDRLIQSSNKMKGFEDFHAVRPALSFQTLKEEIEHFSRNIGSFESIFKHVKRLNDLNGLNDTNKKQSLDEIREKLQEAVIWKKSLERFSGKLEKNFSNGFPDLVSPIVSAISYLHHGISILIHELSKVQARTSGHDVSYNLLRFPVTGVCQQNYLNLTNLCSSERLIFLLSGHTKSRSIDKDRFKMANIALKELENFSLLALDRSKSFWDELNKNFFKIRILWREQEKRREEEAKEKQSLFKTKPEFKEDESDFEKMFPEYRQDFLEPAEMLPGYREDFSESQSTPNTGHDERESFVETISAKDARRVQEIHWTVLRDSRNISLFGDDAKGTGYHLEPNFVDPLAERFEMFGSAITSCTENQSSKLICSLNVLISEKSSFGDRRSNATEVYDFYRDPNIAEVEECQPLFDRLAVRIEDLLKEWPDNPILNSIKLIVCRIYSFSVDSSLFRFLIGAELLLTKIQQWEENARSDVSLAGFIGSFGERILRWRKLEISRWNDSLEVIEDHLKTDASRWWFFLFNLVDQYLADDAKVSEWGKDESGEAGGDVSRQKMIESLGRFLTESPLIEFQPRLELIRLFYRHVGCFEETEKQKELSAILWNVYLYYGQFLNDVQNKIKLLKEPIAKKLNDTIKITRWNDISYWSVKNTAEKTRRTLHKLVKEFQKGLRENVASDLTLKTKTVTAQTRSRRELEPSEFLIELVNKRSEKLDNLTRKARRYCGYIIGESNYFRIRRDIETFIEDAVAESERLRHLEVDKSLTKAKQRSQLKSMLQQKKMALANYFKTLSRLGVSYRIGVLAWRNRRDEINNFAATPLDLTDIQRYKLTKRNERDNNIEEGLIEQWSGCDKYYYESLVKLNFLHGILNCGKSDVGAQNAERCRGLSVHLVLLAHRQKETIADFFQRFLPFRIQVANFALMIEDSIQSGEVKIPRQTSMRIIMKNLGELLETLRVSMQQILVFLQSCPTASPTEEHLLELDETAPPVLSGSNVSGNLVTSMQNSLNTMRNIADELHWWIVVSKRVERSGQMFFYHQRHLDFLRTSYLKIAEIKQRLVHLRIAFTAQHPIAESLDPLIDKIGESNNLFESALATVEESVEESSERKCNLEVYERKLDALITQILLVVQKKLPGGRAPSERTNDPERDAVEEENLITEKWIGSLKKNISDLRLNKVSKILGELSEMIHERDIGSANECVRLLLQRLPLLEQYTMLLHYYLHEQVASFRLTCKFLHLQLNVFLDLATNGFCQPESTDAPEEDQEGGTAEGGMGLADGEGRNDVSEKIESEDQLDETKGPNGEEKDDDEKKRDMKEEEKGIEMSENFDSHLQDLERDREKDDDDDQEDPEEEDLEKEMGETDENAERLDQEIWKDEEENDDDQNEDGKKEEKGTGEKTGREELSAKDDAGGDENENGEQEKDNGDEREEEERNEINEFDEAEVNDDQIDPYHGNHRPEIEPESFDLPEATDLDEETKDDNDDNEENEEDPFDIDRMKETGKVPEEKANEDAAEQEDVGEDEQQQDSSYDEDDEEKEEGDSKMEPDERRDERNTNVDEDETNGTEGQQNTEVEESETEEDKARPSVDSGSKETDASRQVEAGNDGSRDAVERSDEQTGTSSTENVTEDKNDEGTGRSQTENRQGHSGSNEEENAPLPGEEKTSRPAQKRRKPGESDEDRSLLDDKVQPLVKMMKTAPTRRELDNNEEKGNDQGGGESEAYQHIKNTEQFDDYVYDAATEEQIKKQASSLDVEKEEPDDQSAEEKGDIEMHEDPIAEDHREQVNKDRSERVAGNEREKSTNARGEEADFEGKVEVEGQVEGDTVETARVLRGNESTIHTKLPDTERCDISPDNVAEKRCEIESMLGEWSHGPSSAEAATAWSSISALTESAARELAEKLRLVLEPTLTSRLKGDYRTGRRINMRKVIPYIASEFRKDKIWLRRTKPSKRDYQIVLAIDDSSSMADNHSKELAFESLSLIGKAMTYLEVGQLAVVNFGERVNILHPFGENFTEETGARLIQQMKFEQTKTMIARLLDFTIEMFSSQTGSSDNAKLVAILSDGRGIFSEGIEKVTSVVRRSKLLNIFLVFIIVDNPLNKDSILDIRMPVFESGKLLGIRSYMDNFPFPFYIILRDLNSLPIVLSDALRQWFEIVGRIDT